MAITGRFPLWQQCLVSLALLVDELHLRFDLSIGLAETPTSAIRIAASLNKFCRVEGFRTPWDNVHWREEMLRMLDDVHPDFVLTCDEDEQFGPGIERDLERLRLPTVCPQMAFEYEHPMPTVDDWRGRIKPYPSKSHVKAYRWRPGLTYLPYRGRARLANYGKHEYVLGRSKMRHYCLYTPELRKAKKELLNTAGKTRWHKEKCCESVVSARAG